GAQSWDTRRTVACEEAHGRVSVCAWSVLSLLCASGAQSLFLVVALTVRIRRKVLSSPSRAWPIRILYCVGRRLHPFSLPPGMISNSSAGIAGAPPLSSAGSLCSRRLMDRMDIAVSLAKHSYPG